MWLGIFLGGGGEVVELRGVEFCFGKVKRNLRDTWDKYWRCREEYSE